MSFPPQDWRTFLASRGRVTKRALLAGMDFVILTFSLWAGYALRLNELYVPPNWKFAAILAAAPFIGIVVFWRFSLYRLVTRYIDARGARKIVLASATSVLVFVLFFQLTGTTGSLPRSTIILYGVLTAGLVWLSRAVIGWLLKGTAPLAKSLPGEPSQKRVLIYGAGAVGIQLLEDLRRKPEYLPVAFIDENPGLQQQKLNGLKVYAPDLLGELIERRGIDEIMLALPEATRQKRKDLSHWLRSFGLTVRVLPSMEDIASGRVEVSDIRDINADALLGRAAVKPDETLLDRTIRGKVVLVTGAGGSIGSEIARQIVQLGPRALILFEVSEAALYHIEMELRQLTLVADPDRVALKIAGVLGSVLDAETVRRTIAQHGVETIFHAAAYKHVPIVEANPVAGIRNNTFGTKVVAEAARDLGVTRMVLISTDKAVRPTNIMGASKRLAELVLQAQASEAGSKTVFTMVRFGNVLDSSGSVVKLFRQQIQNGGPVTVTHKDITRYFMSIPEAATLVIQAGAMAKGGEVFVLDMGEPVRIDEMARKMIKLMGGEVRDEQNPGGDIAIVYSGLRPGEKLYEELLIGDNTTATEHPRIQQSLEPAMTPADLAREFDALQGVLGLDDVEAIQAVLKRTVEGYVPDTRTAAAASAVAQTLLAGKTRH